MTTKIPAELSSTPGISDTSNATAITIDSNEKVGIGTTSPATTLDVTSSSDEAVYLRSTHATTTNVFITNTNATTGNTASLVFAPANNITGATIKCEAIEDFSTSANRTADLLFLTRKDGTLAERMRIHSDGDVSIGGTSSDPLSLSFSGTGLTINEDSGVAYFQIDGGNTARIDFGQGGTRNFNIYSDASNYSEFKRTTNHPILFGTNNAERMRITSTGVLTIGKTTDDSTTAGIWLRKHATGGQGQIMCAGAGSSAYEGFYVYDITNSEMEFMASYHGTVYYRALASLSDERKKDNIQNITLGLDAVKELRPVSFDWKNDKGNDQLGFIAQEVETTSLKQLVSTYKDENIEDLRRLNKEGLIPVLVKAIQELSAKVEELESKINE